MDIKNEMLGLAKRNLEAYESVGREPGQSKIAIQNIENMESAWDENDRESRQNLYKFLQSLAKEKT